MVLAPIELSVKMLRFAPVLFVKGTLYSVYVNERGTLSYGGLSMFLHRYAQVFLKWRQYAQVF